MTFRFNPDDFRLLRRECDRYPTKANAHPSLVDDHYFAKGSHREWARQAEAKTDGRGRPPTVVSGAGGSFFTTGCSRTPMRLPSA